MQIWHGITQVWVGDKVNVRFLHILKCCTFTFSLWWKPIWWVETRNIDVNKQHSTSYGDQKWGDLGGLHSNKSRPELRVSRLTARSAIRVATRIVMFLVWPRPELSCVVTRNKTLSRYRNYMRDCVDWFEAVAWLRMENIVAIIIIMCEERFDNALQNCQDWLEAFAQHCRIYARTGLDWLE